MGDNSSGRWGISRFIPFADHAANSINKAANNSRTATDKYHGWKQTREREIERNLLLSKAEQTNIHGPDQAITVANNDPKSWPNVAPAPMNPNNLEPDWTQNKCKCTPITCTCYQVWCGSSIQTSLSMTSITLAQVEEIVIRLSSATFKLGRKNNFEKH